MSEYSLSEIQSNHSNEIISNNDSTNSILLSSLNTQNPFEIQNKSAPDKKYKIILVGNAGVGKTCLILKSLNNKFIFNNPSTLGFEYYNILAHFPNKKILLQTWDTCGQENFKSIVSTFYKRAKLAILIYSIDDEISFNDINFWLNEIKKKSNDDIKLILIGNKTDLNNRKITKQIAENYAKKNGFDFFLETSAKEKNTEEIFIKAAELLYENDIKKEKELKEKGEEYIDYENENNFYLNEEEEYYKDDVAKSCGNCF
jgi:small GTP-binding protein